MKFFGQAEHGPGSNRLDSGGDSEFGFYREPRIITQDFMPFTGMT